MDFSVALNSDSAKAHAYAAVFLRGEGVNGYPFVSMLLERCKAVDINQELLNEHEEKLVLSGALSLGTIVNAKGFDDENALHRDVRDWLIALTFSAHTHFTAHGIYGLGEMQNSPPIVSDRLVELANSELRDDDATNVISCRAVAFRVLSKIDRSRAISIKGSPACAEYLQAIGIWLANSPENTKQRIALQAESSWLRQ